MQGNNQALKSVQSSIFRLQGASAIICIIIIGQFGCLPVSREHGLGWAGGLAGQGPSVPGLAGHVGRPAAASALQQGATVFARS